MALIDVVKCEVNDREFVYKYPSEDLRVGTQLVVYTGQTAYLAEATVNVDMHLENWIKYQQNIKR